MQNRNVLLVAAITSLLWCGAASARAQEQSSETKTAKPQVIEAYRLDFSFNELEGEKKINTRHYTMNLTSGEGEQIKIGTRVPVTTSYGSTSGSQYQYVDVGTSIHARLKPVGQNGEEQLEVGSDVSNLDLTAEAARAANVGNVAPVIRQIRIEGVTLLALGKSLLIGSMDDPNSKKQFQLEVTVTKLR